jgi:hypothetical protein
MSSSSKVTGATEKKSDATTTPTTTTPTSTSSTTPSLKAKKTIEKEPTVCCELTEKNFWITMGIFAVIWGVSVQYPFIIESTVEVPGVIHSDAFAKLTHVGDWPQWQSVYGINVTDDVDTNSFFFISPRSLPFNATVQVRVTNNDATDKSLCWTWEQISPFMSAFHCHNVSRAGDSEYGHARLLNHQVFYGPLALLLHIYSFDLANDVVRFNQQFIASFDDYA